MIDSVATFADTDVSVERKQDFLRSTHLTEIPLPRADLGGNVRREGGSNRGNVRREGGGNRGNVRRKGGGNRGNVRRKGGSNRGNVRREGGGNRGNVRRKGGGNRGNVRREGGSNRGNVRRKGGGNRVVKKVTYSLLKEKTHRAVLANVLCKDLVNLLQLW